MGQTNMSGKPGVFSMRGDVLKLALLALIIFGLSASFQQQPGYMDAHYYYSVGKAIAQGRGFVEDFLVNYLDNPAGLPHPSNLYWMPLPSLLAAAGMAVAGVSLNGARIFLILAAACLAPVAYALTAITLRRRLYAWIAGLLAIFSGFYFPYWTAVDSFALFAVAGSLGLILAGLAAERRGGSGLFFLSGFFCGLGHLARADGALLLLCILFWLAMESHFRKDRDGAPWSRWKAAGLLCLGYLLAMAPWFIRNMIIIGAPLPSFGMQTIWMLDYNDLYAYNRTFTAASYVQGGLARIWSGKWWALQVNLQSAVAVVGMIFLGPLAVLGGWQLRRQPLFRLAGLYGLALFGVMTFVFTYPGPRGAFFHSSGALLPFVYCAALQGLETAIGFVARRRRQWRVPAARRFFSVGIVLLAVMLSGIIVYNKVREWNSSDSYYGEIARWVEAQGAAEQPLMLVDPPAYINHGGRSAISTPNEPPDIVYQVARRYGARYLVLERGYYPLPLEPLYAPHSALPHFRLATVINKDSDSPAYIYEFAP